MTEISPTPSPETPTPTPEIEPASPGSLLGTEPNPAPPAEEAPKPETEKPAEPEQTEFSFEGIEVPEGLQISDDQKAAVSEVAKKHGLSKDAVGSLLPLVRDALKAESESSARLWEDTNKKWTDEIKADPEYGGAKLEGNLTQIAKMIDSYAPDAKGVREALNLTGAGNHPALVRFMTKLAGMVNEGSSVPGTQPAPRKTGAQAMYPDLPSAGG